MKKQKVRNFWNPHQRMRPVMKVKMPKMNINKEAKNMIKMGIGIGIAGVALGLGIAAFQDVSG